MTNSFVTFVHLTKGKKRKLAKAMFDLYKGPRNQIASSAVSLDGQEVPNMAMISDLSDQDVLIQYCLQSKVDKTAMDELLKRGYDSLDAFKLVNIEQSTNCLSLGTPA